MITAERMVAIAGAVVAVVLQVLLAPHIIVGFAAPNFAAAFCLALAIARPDGVSPVLPFVLGLLYDLLSGGPVGGMAFVLTAFSALTAWVFRRVNNDTLFMALSVLAASVLLVELSYGILYLLLGYAANVVEAFVYRVLPCFVYDAVLALISYLVIGRLAARSVPSQPEITQLH